MELYVDKNCFILDQPSEAELARALPASILASVKENLAKGGADFEAWTRDQSSFLFIHGEDALAFWVRDLCGKRMVLLGSTLRDSEVLRSDLFLLAEKVGKSRGCHLMQWSIPRARYEKRDWSVPPGFYATNLIFERPVSMARPEPAPLSFESLDFSSRLWKQAAAEREYWVRWTFPGSTYAPLDLMGELYAEYNFYPKLAEKHLADGIGWKEDPTKAYVLWIQSAATALIAMIWIDPAIRENISGNTLLQAAIERMSASDLSRVGYFVSAQNISAMKMLHRSGFELTRYNLNKALT